MKFIEHSGLTKLSVLLSNLDTGDKIIQGKLELFTCAEKLPAENKLSQQIDNEIMKSPDWLQNSPIGPVYKREVREILVNLISTMNQCFPDYDFSSLTPDSLKRENDFLDAYTNINYHLAHEVEQIIPGFIHDFWENVRDVINVQKVNVYSYVGIGDADPFNDEECFFSLDYFFYDYEMQRILFFSCMTKKKRERNGDINMHCVVSDATQNEFINSESEYD